MAKITLANLEDVTQLSESITNVEKTIYVDTTEPTLRDNYENYALNGSGGTVSNSDCLIKRYKVVEGQKLHLKLSKDTNGVFQFSRDSAVHPNYIVGTCYTSAIDGYVTVPSTATYLFVSQLKTNDTNIVSYYDDINKNFDIVNADIDELNDIIDGKQITLYGKVDFSVSGLNGSGENTTNLYRVSSTEFIAFDYDLNVRANNGFRFGIIIKEGSSYFNTEWQTSYIIPKNKQFKISISKIPEERVNDNSESYIKSVLLDSKLEHRLSVLERGTLFTPWENEIHRGIVSNTIAENTIPALIETSKNGFKRLECDVRKTADNVIVMCHDATVTGTVNGVPTTYTIAEVTYSTLSNLVLSTDEVYGTISVPSFSDYLDKAYFYGLTLNIDIKDGIVSRNDVARVVVQKGMSGRVVYNTNSNDYRTFDEIIAIDKRARFLATYNADNIAEYADKYDLEMIEIAVASANITQEIARSIRNSGFVFMLYDVYNSTPLDYRPDIVEFATISLSQINSILSDYMSSHT